MERAETWKSPLGVAWCQREGSGSSTTSAAGPPLRRTWVEVWQNGRCPVASTKGHSCVIRRDSVWSPDAREEGSGLLG